MITPNEPLHSIKTGNQTLVRQCADELLALRDMNYSREQICKWISEFFDRDESLLTPDRLSSILNKIVKCKTDSPQEKALRLGRIDKLKSDVNLILQNLRVKGILYKQTGNVLAVVQPQPLPQRAFSSPASAAPVQKTPMEGSPASPVASDFALQQWTKILNYIKSSGYKYDEGNVPKVIAAIEANPQLYDNKNPHKLYSLVEKMLSTGP